MQVCEEEDTISDILTDELVREKRMMRISIFDKEFKINVYDIFLIKSD